MVETVILLFVCLQLKHLFIDFYLQRPYQWMNKGTYGHPGGIEHAALHGVGTAFVFGFFVDPITVIALAFLDGGIHYHVDWAKMNINKKYGWKPTEHPQFWNLLGLDQFIHQLTYCLLIYFALTN